MTDPAVFLTFDFGAVYTMHPQVIGRLDRLAKFGAFVEHVCEADGEFAEVRDVAAAGRPNRLRAPGAGWGND
ncbi:hypothetical protein [Halobaculum lipolyticum]|uniref:Uncharacterized protein n=1 Tax=Halobaculum lipolyticum TaxID=3032001 RepID=A0ABD5WAK6_9EURY|nr:hypothetical protein [Halobaculum sp. DT31]